MGKSVAVMIDGGYLLKEFRHFENLTPNKRIEVRHIRAVAEAAVTSGEELFRIYYYHCPPFGADRNRPFGGDPVSFGQTDVFRRQEELQTGIRLEPRFALRRGELRWRGWRCKADRIKDPDAKARDIPWEPDFQQKCVDMKIGLDVAWLASKRIVNIIAMITGDTDFVPAMKFARTEGVQVRLVAVGQASPHNNLLEHSDDVVSVDLRGIAEA